MNSESRIDPKIMEEVLKFSKNVIDAPKLVSAPDEIILDFASRILEIVLCVFQLFGKRVKADPISLKRFFVIAVLPR